MSGGLMQLHSTSAKGFPNLEKPATSEHQHGSNGALEARGGALQVRTIIHATKATGVKRLRGWQACRGLPAFRPSGLPAFLLLPRQMVMAAHMYRNMKTCFQVADSAVICHAASTVLSCLPNQQ